MGPGEEGAKSDHVYDYFIVFIVFSYQIPSVASILNYREYPYNGVLLINHSSYARSSSNDCEEFKESYCCIANGVMQKNILILKIK